MSRTIIILASVFSSPILLLVDAALKATAVLLLAAIAAAILRRDSAATRHLVWLLAIVAMLAVPALSAMLPEWRVLPEWASIPPATGAASPPSVASPAVDAFEAARSAAPDEVETSFASAHPPAAAPPDSPPASFMPEAPSAPAVWNWNWRNTLTVAWAIGFCVLILRLLAASWMLWNSERQGTVIWPPKQPTQKTHDAIGTALETALSQLGIHRPVTVLIHSGRTIPVVWGILRCRVLLPAAARDWSGEQLRSVLLHELAHIKRRDTLVQLPTQVACALHWFNPLAWFAAWRLGVERERACDDLVLASGVRPSAYAGHLLDVVTQLSPARWTRSCGLAMARKSSLEGRLVAVLSENLNRRGVSAALAALAFAIAVGFAVPIAMLRAADDPAQQQGPQQPNDSAKLPPGLEEKLQWGETVNGLRAALVRPQALGEPEAREIFDFKLVVQNVSDAPVRLRNAAAPKSHYLKIRKDGRILAAFHDSAPIGHDFTLQPREVAILRLFSGRTEGASITKDDPGLTFSVELKIEKAPARAWTGTLVTADTSATFAAHGLTPKHKVAQALFKVWTANARADGKIPGALIGLLAEDVTTFTKYNPTWETTPQLLKMLPRFDATRDWSGQDGLALLDELAAVQDLPIHVAVEQEAERTVRTGSPLPPALANAPWGEALSNGLRLAWLLEPRAAEHRLNTPLKSRILIHNAGKEPVVFRTRTWHQGRHEARDANGADIKVDSTEWLTRAPLVPFRLAPGEFIELNATGIGVGANKNDEDWQNTRVGSWIDAQAGIDVTVTTGPVPLSDWNEQPPLDGEPRWWLDFITSRLQRHLPLPADADARKLMLYRVAMELFGTPVSNEINVAFVADRELTALDSLAKRLFHRPGLHAWAGALQSGPTRFRVLPADPDAAKKPRTANNPGRYTLGNNAVLAVTRRPVGERFVNEANIQFFSPDATKPAPGEPYQLNLPDGYDTWAAAWLRGANVIWVAEKGAVRSVDFTNPAQVKETSLEEPADLEKVPRPILDALRTALDVPAVPKPAVETPAPAADTLKPATETPK